MKKLLFIGVALGLFLTSCHKKDHCYEPEVMVCGTEDDHKDWSKEDYDKSNYYSDDLKEEKDWDKEGELEDKEVYEKDWDKEDKKWWKKKSGYDMEDCYEVYPGKN